MNDRNAWTVQISEISVDKAQGFLPGDHEGWWTYQTDFPAHNVDMPIRILWQRLVVTNQRSDLPAPRRVSVPYSLRRPKPRLHVEVDDLLIGPGQRAQTVKLAGAGPVDHSRFCVASRVAFPLGDEVGALI
jgi:hypothetical protein